MGLIDHRRYLHSIPEAGFNEHKTTEYIEKVLSEIGGWRIEKPISTGLVAFKEGTKSSQCVAFRADIDALPICEDTALSYSSKHQGFMHACGHDMHMAVVLGLAEYLSGKPCQEDVLLVFQPAEEGPGGALPMIETGVLKKYGVSKIYALHVSPEYPVGVVATRAGVLFANTSELFVDLIGTSGHAALPHKGNDMVVAGANLALQLHTIVSRNINPGNRAVVTVGELKCGVRQNVIAEHARIAGTIRTIDEGDMKLIKRRVNELVSGVITGFGIEAVLSFGAEYCAVVNDDKVVGDFKEMVDGMSGIEYVESVPTMTGEDFGYFLKEVPGMLFWLGVAHEDKEDHGLHTPKFNPNEEALDVGLRVFCNILSY